MKWKWVWWAAAAVTVLHALRLRARATALQSLPTVADGEGPAPRWMTAPGVELDGTTRAAASTYMAQQGITVLDLVPGDLSAERALDLLNAVDPRAYRADRSHQGVTAGQAMALDNGLAARAGLSGADGVDPVSFEQAARLAKQYGAGTTDLVVAPGLRAGAEDLDRRRAVWRSRFGSMWAARAALPVAGYAFLAAGVVVAPLAGAVAVAAWAALPVLALAGSPLRPRDLWWRSALRPVIGPLTHARALAGRWRPPPGADSRVDVAALRPVYAALLADGTAPFFEPRRDTCPLCGSRHLEVRLRTRDLIQAKPGRFTLERCQECGLIFQNPRLSIAGLDFYYRDFYDGIGEEQVGFVFGEGADAYEQRAALLKGHAEPNRWLDVGAGHAHFCMVAAQTWPSTRFDGLDMSEAIEEAERRGWVTTGYRGMLPDLAPQLAGQYDVVSMHHYLEHTRSPLEELSAAAGVLAPGGHLAIELPDPGSAFARALGKYWFPWFQPQHQYLLSCDRVCEALEDLGLVVVERRRGVADHPIDLVGAVYLLLNRVAPPTGLPWRPARRPLAAAWRWTALALLVPFFALALVADRVLAVATRPTWRSNAFRVLARKPAPGQA